ncbi:hypothetical protein MLD38_019148 [Melastoma candidum]|uniref:Uncharacterized protein n=1 Tax=Melastoma candidum TaxID=119954 RepID=A0ACB9QW19_9MYRT|nr:hypothetical protein MLD38_019148 [Melastoma candidum]
MGVATAAKTRVALSALGGAVNVVVSFVVFVILDVLDFVLCYVYKVADFLIEAEWRPCYCSSPKGLAANGGDIFVSENGGSKVVCLSSSKVQLEEISDTLFSRRTLAYEVSSSTLRRLRSDPGPSVSSSYYNGKGKRMPGATRGQPSFTVSSAVIEMLPGRIVGQVPHPIRRWSDCDCKHCTSWSSGGSKSLFVRSVGPKDNKAREDVLFIHGFISSSQFWTETVFPNFSDAARSTYRLLAIDLLGFGRSPKPSDSFYTLREHVGMIEQTVIIPHRVRSFHIVAHSLGCVLALALAVKHPNSVKSLTLLAPPYYPVPKERQAEAAQYVMGKVAPRRVWPIISLGASIACRYEHITRTACLVVCKHHLFWESVTKIITMNRIRTFLFDCFFCHTTNSAWHTLHNVICGSAGKLEGYLDAVRDRLKCDVNIFHGADDELIPVKCSYNVQRRIPRARVKVVEKKDHITIVVGRQEAFARELEEIWRK